MAEYRNDDTRMKRRNFLKGLWGISILTLFGQAGAALYNYFKPRIKPGGFGSKITAGEVAEFAPETVSHIASGRFYISRLEDGHMIALWHRCTHLGCTVPWREDEGQFHCPCHSSLFNRTGEVIGGPAPRPLDYFSINIDDKNQVIVDTGNPKQRDHYDLSQAVKP